jgi:methionyl-tRNA formyltransferase
VRWDRPAAAVSRLVRACTPAPGAWTELNGARLKLWPFAGIVTDDHEVVPGPGRLCVRGSQVLVGTGTQPVQLGDVQPHGKRQMPAADWARGLRLDTSGAVLG